MDLLIKSKGYSRVANSEVEDHDADLRHQFQLKALRKYAILIIPFGTLCIIGASLQFILFKDNKETNNPSKSNHDPIYSDNFNFNYPQLNLKKCEAIPINMRFDCHPDDVNVNSETCHARGCCWEEIDPNQIDGDRQSKHNDHNFTKEKIQKEDGVQLSVPYCYYPKGYSLYNFTDVVQFNTGINAKLRQINKSAFPKDLPLVEVEIHYETCSRIRITLFDPAKKRFRSNIPDLSQQADSTCRGKRAYHISLVESEGRFVVSRSDTGLPLFDTTNAAPLVYSDQFLQLSTIFPSPYIYGLGQHLNGLLLDVYWKRRTLWNADLWPMPDKNLYGSHPFYMVMEPTGSAHGVFLFNTNAMDIVLQPTPAATFHVTGGIIDLFILLGPTPDDVVSQYSELVGKPFLPPYWSLGYHQCRFGYQNLTNTKKVWQRTKDAGIPFDVQWNDIDYMVKQNDFTYDKERFAGLPQFVKELHKEGMHYVVITDCGISAGEKPGTYPPYDLGMKYDIFVKNSSGKPFIGKVWNPIATVWPDFTHPMSLDYWHTLIKGFHKEVSFDGLWIDMNEPSNFWSGQKDGCPDNSLENPPYLPRVFGGKLYYHTLCMSAKQHLGLHYDVHNLYGFTEAIVTFKSLKALKIGRPFIISRSSFSGLGYYAGHWTGDVHSDWFNLWKSIGDTLTFNILGIPMVGADICGFNGNTTVALCNRWMQLGAFYPFSRNHNTDDGIDQDPVAMGPLVIKSSIKAFEERYKLLPTLYSLFVRAHLTGMPVAKPLFFNFPQDVSTYSLDTQFMWGESFMIVPVLKENSTQVTAYFPAGRWYNWYTGGLVTAEGPKYLDIPAPLDTIPLFTLGGHILPCHTPGSKTTTQSRKTPFGLVVALDDDGQAQGEIYWDDGLSFDSYKDGSYLHGRFRAVSNRISSSFDVKEWKPQQKMTLGWIHIFGIKDSVRKVYINDELTEFKYSSDLKTLQVDFDLDFTSNIDLTWQ